MNSDFVLQINVPLDLIKKQDIYVISSYASNVKYDYLKIVGLIVDINASTSKFRNTIFDALLVNNEIELILPINVHTYLRVNHMTIDKHTGRYIVWGKDFTGN